MTRYDAIVIGGGTGNNTALAAAAAGNEVALIEPGPLGGTCLNRGCNPSKMLIQHANVANGVREANGWNMEASLSSIDFPAIVSGVNERLGDVAESMERSAFVENDDIDLYREYAEFTDERELVTESGEELAAETVVVAAGTRPIHPGFIDGIEDVDYLTSDDAVRLTERPDELVIVGGGYIACELGYFFDAMGADVTVVEMMDTLLPREDAEVAEAFTEIAGRRHDVYTDHAADVVREEGDRVVVEAESEDGGRIEVSGDELLVAVGRRPNTDTLNVEAAGIETDERGFVRTNEYLETTAEGVWAQGDIAGNFLFKHTGDYETEVVSKNAFGDGREPADYTGVGHAVFTAPEIAAMGPTEGDLREAGQEYVVGRATLADTSMGRARRIEDGFVKVLAAPDGELLGTHIVGEEASDLIHQAILTKRLGGTVEEAAGAIYVHPALSKVMKAAFEDAVSRGTTIEVEG